MPAELATRFISCRSCGPARHSRLLAAQGLRGVAVDNCPAMLEHASKFAQQDGVSVEFVAGDIRRQCLPVSINTATAPVAWLHRFAWVQPSQRHSFHAHRMADVRGSFTPRCLWRRQAQQSTW